MQSYKSYSLNGPGAAQLSQSVKDRFASGTNSLPKSGLDMHVFHARLAIKKIKQKIFFSLFVSLQNYFHLLTKKKFLFPKLYPPY